MGCLCYNGWLPEAEAMWVKEEKGEEVVRT